MQRRTVRFLVWLIGFCVLLSRTICGVADVSAGLQLLPGLQMGKITAPQGDTRAPRPPAPVPSPEASYEKADSREVLAQLFGPNTNAFVRAPVEPDTLFPIRPAYYAALTVPGAMGCPELPLVVVEEDVAFAPGFNRQVSSAYRSALTLAGSEPFVLNLYRPSPVEQLDIVMQRLRHIQNRSAVASSICRRAAATGLFEDSWGSLPKEIPLASAFEGPAAWGYGAQGMMFSPFMTQALMLHFHQVQTGQRPVPGYQDIIILNLVHHRARCYGLLPVAGNTTAQPCHVMRTQPGPNQTPIRASALLLLLLLILMLLMMILMLMLMLLMLWRLPLCSANMSLIQHTGTASALFGNKSTRFHVAEDFPVVHRFATEDPEGTW
ncbi:hypothetical protein QJQ45_015020 [Haematococcus lacustris]|nr:hypothetical protein QJQ45_015020 [Haematococcus lacustris]